ncbi:MAG: tRNA (N(6)-L-threonylcarbamoyladenosine(37)-C(2))-methylthiotransferase MtaB [Candidatus Krumholzibacteriota bacterium]|nr:tRNA (N(6)-L-threonylcarbamoyladenosine(37)-C(2))-methylthiotransferase MtaB [Candidatus Krumholzibacteriota bacterium]
MKRNFAITTLGCKLNQYESECIRHDLTGRGWERRDFDMPADFYVINTCTVTSKTDARCRNAIRRARKNSPDAVIIATGCLAQTQFQKLESMKEVDFVFNNEEKGRIAEFLEKYIKNGNDLDRQNECVSSFDIDIDSFSNHSRAFMKVQDGCDSKCSYCIIPEARGRSRSIPPADVIRKIRRLAGNSYMEIVLTGIHIGRYGMDPGSGIDLAGLIEEIISAIDGIRIRLSSIEPVEVSRKLSSLVIDSPRVASHLHIPLQSGDDKILRSMNRPYSTEQFRILTDDLKDRSSGLIIGTDIITGFPGETDREFENTYAYLADLKVDYFHVFSYSKRPGTPAASMEGHLDPRVIRSRCQKLIELGRRKRLDFMRKMVGRQDLALIQGPESEDAGIYNALTGNYCEVAVEAPAEMAGKLVEIEISRYSKGRLYGKLC